MRVMWALSAEQDRIDIADFIAQDNPLAAIGVDELFAAAAMRLGEHPHIGRLGQIAGTRELVAHESYRMVYEVRDDTVWILAVVHTARTWPPRRV
jgi:toxin ParE1/3/4